jgi:hypothetical protein
MLDVSSNSDIIKARHPAYSRKPAFKRSREIVEGNRKGSLWAHLNLSISQNIRLRLLDIVRNDGLSGVLEMCDLRLRWRTKGLPITRRVLLNKIDLAVLELVKTVLGTFVHDRV